MKACPECGGEVERIEIKNTWRCKKCQTFWKVKKSFVTSRILSVERKSYCKINETLSVILKKEEKNLVPAPG